MFPQVQNVFMKKGTFFELYVMCVRCPVVNRVFLYPHLKCIYCPLINYLWYECVWLCSRCYHVDYSTGPVGGNVLRFTFTIVYFQKLVWLVDMILLRSRLSRSQSNNTVVRFIGDMILFLLIIFFVIILHQTFIIICLRLGISFCLVS